MSKVLLSGLATAVLAALLVSCSSGKSNSAGISDAQVMAAQPGPGFPGNGLPNVPGLDDAPARETSVNLNIYFEGVEYYDTNAAVNGVMQLHMEPNTGELGSFIWAIYKFSGLAEDANVSAISAAMSDLTVDGTYYFALADHGSMAWEYYPVVATSATQTFNVASAFDPARHISPGSSFYFAVMTYELLATVEYVNLQASGSLTAPQNFSASDSASGEEVRLGWDQVPGAEAYDIFYKESGQPDEFYGFLASAAATPGTQQFLHTDTDPPGKTSVFGTEYEYKVRATADGEDPSPFSLPDVGTRRYPTPTFLEATDDQNEGLVYLAWRTPDTGPGERSFKVIVDDGPATLLPIVTTYEGLFFAGVQSMDPGAHSFKVVETGAEGDGLESPADTGSRAEMEHLSMLSQPTTSKFYADMEQAAHSPNAAAVCYSLSSTDEIRYVVIEDGAKLEDHFFTKANPDGSLDLENHLGRPWVAYTNENVSYGPAGVYIARSNWASQPVFDTDWDTYLVYEGDMGSGEVNLEIIGGRLALVFGIYYGIAERRLHYAYANVDDPQSQGDWTVTVVGEYTDNDLFERHALIEWQGLPLIAHHGGEGAQLSQASSLTPAGTSEWSHYDLPLNGAPIGVGQGIDAFIDDGELFVATAEGGTGGDGQFILTSPTAWPPGATDWYEQPLLGVSNVNFGGVAMLKQAGRPRIILSQDDADNPLLLSPIIPDDSLTWDLNTWLAMRPEASPVYNQSIQEVALAEVGGQLAMLYVCRVNDGTTIELVYSRIKGNDG